MPNHLILTFFKCLILSDVFYHGNMRMLLSTHFLGKSANSLVSNQYFWL